ncbi:pRL2-8 [Streptomyces flavofungini]
MAAKECAQCVAHAQLHKGNWLGIGKDNTPCAACEDHAANGCPGINRR